MAGTSLFALIDDIATLLDDLAVMTKVAARKTAGVLGDDLALNAQQVAGVRADRELPVVWAVAKGSLTNKLILIPTALAISALAPWAVTPLLMLGGAFLCYEGAEKLAHRMLHPRAAPDAHADPAPDPGPVDMADLANLERRKIRGAIRTDFVLSAEIIVIALGTVAGLALGTQLAVLVAIGLLMTVGVYGLVAGLVKLDDAGLFLSQRPGTGVLADLQRRLGWVLLSAAPVLMHGLAIVGTLAMFLVGGGILLHGVPGSHTLLHALEHSVAGVPVIGSVLALLSGSLAGLAAGVLAGLLLLAGAQLGARLYRAIRP